MDLYSLLGVSRSASAAEIERAYRRLARRYHPGVNPGDRVSREMYEQVQRAYEVLGDAARRRDYDHGPRQEPAPDRAITFEGFDFSAPVEGPRAATFAELFADVFQDAAREATAPSRGADIELDLTVSFRDAVRGGEVPLSVTRQERCSACAGVGRVRRPPLTCPQCDGAGTRRWARGHLVFTKDCEACEGRGQLDREGCRHCGGVGTTPRTEVVTLGIPAGIESGARVAVPGRGHAGARGGPAGDLYITVTVAPHPIFRREGRDLYLVVPVGVHEVALGARVEIPTLEGPARLRIPPGTASGQRLRLRGRGVGPHDGTDGAGDLIIELQVVLPQVIDETSRALLAEFGRLNPVDVRQSLFEQA